MAIEPFIRIENRLTDKNFADAEQLDFEFNRITEYLNTKLLPVLNTLFDMQVLASNKPEDLNGYLYENEEGLLAWKKPENIRTLLPLLEPPMFNIAILGKKRYTEHLDWYSIEYVEDGIVTSSSTNVFSIKKINDNFFENNIFKNNNFLDNSILQKKISNFNNVTEIEIGGYEDTEIALEISKKTYSQYSDDIMYNLKYRFDPQNGFLSINCIKDNSIVNLRVDNYQYEPKSILRGLPPNLYGVGNSYQLQEYIPRLNRIGYVDATTRNTLDDFAPFPKMLQLLSDSDDLMTGNKFENNAFSVFFLSIIPTEIRTFKQKMNIPARCFADKSIGINGAFYDEKVFADQLTPQRLFRAFPVEATKYDRNNTSVHPDSADLRICYYVDNLFNVWQSLHYIELEDETIDIDFFPKRIQDKINAV